MKRMIRMMLLSDAFRQSSQPSPDGMEKDAGTSLLWRFPPKRVEAEVIRDAILQASGKLDRNIWRNLVAVYEYPCLRMVVVFQQGNFRTGKAATGRVDEPVELVKVDD